MNILRILQVLSLSIIISSTTYADPGTVGVGLYGSAVWGGLPASGAEFDIHFGNRLSIGAQFLSQKADFSGVIDSAVEAEDLDYDYTIEKAEMTRQAGMLNLKFFPFAGSLTLGAGLGAGTFQSQLKMNSNETSEEIDEDYTYQQSLAALTVGNNWRWKHFYFGFDWLGFAGVIANQEKKESNTTESLGKAMAKALKEYEDTNDLFGQQGGIIFLSARIGVGF